MTELPMIQYPCTWSYTIIGEGEEALRLAVSGVMGDRDHTVTPGHHSAAGRYCSLHVTLMVLDEEERLCLLAALQREAVVRFVL